MIDLITCPHCRRQTEPKTVKHFSKNNLTYSVFTVCDQCGCVLREEVFESPSLSEILEEANYILFKNKNDVVIRSSLIIDWVNQRFGKKVTNINFYK